MLIEMLSVAAEAPDLTYEDLDPGEVFRFNLTGIQVDTPVQADHVQLKCTNNLWVHLGSALLGRMSGSVYKRSTAVQRINATLTVNGVVGTEVVTG